MYNLMSDQDDGSKPVINEPQQPPEYSPASGYPPQSGYPPPAPLTEYPPQAGYPPQPVYPTSSQMSSSNTTVVIQQPQTQVIVQGPRGWSSGLCSCFDDCGVCCLGFFCPCALQCMLSSDAGECCCVAQMCPIALRTKIRTRHNIHGDILDDCCIICWCPHLALCQMAREVNLNGI